MQPNDDRYWTYERILARLLGEEDCDGNLTPLGKAKAIARDQQLSAQERARKRWFPKEWKQEASASRILARIRAKREVSYDG